jgi:hypothetical protein
MKVDTMTTLDLLSYIMILMILEKGKNKAHDTTSPFTETLLLVTAKEKKHSNVL